MPDVELTNTNQLYRVITVFMNDVFLFRGNVTHIVE